MGLQQQLPVLPVRDQVLFPGVVMTLQVARAKSREALQLAQAGERLLFVVSQRAATLDEPSHKDLFRVGTVAEVLHVVPLPDGSARVILRGIHRAKVASHAENGTVLVNEIKTTEKATQKIAVTKRLAIDQFGLLAGRHRQIPPESLEAVINAQTSSDVADTISYFLPIEVSEKQALLEQLDNEKRLREVLQILKREEHLLDLEENLKEEVGRSINEAQKEFFLHEQLKTIQKELGIRESRYEELAQKVNQAELPSEIAANLQRELSRLQQMEAYAPEAQVVRAYIETVLDLPWATRAVELLDLNEASRRLDENHFGLDSVKDRVLEFLSVRKLKGTKAGAVLCFVGPPGVGKTSLAQTVAEALDRQCVQVALGGVRDEAEIRGHRRTYVGARPGRLIQAIREAGSMNPVVVLDELDKVAQGSHGDPMSALLEVLDPEQNRRFVDHYLELPVDLSEIVFIATANLLDHLPQPLFDRMEIIEFPGYTEVERVQIAKSHIEPVVAAESGLVGQMPLITEEALQALASEYTRESGVRALRREFARLGRKLARKAASGETLPPVIDRDTLVQLLGRPPISASPVNEESEIGLTHGLVVTGYGGDRMPVEVSLTKPLGTDPKLTLTGAVGPVLQESVQTALTCVRRLLDTKGIDSRFDVHVHLPQAAIPKDGPSAGLTVSIALYSAFTGRAVRRDVAMTGEVTLRGQVLPVGGLREKILAARRYGYATVLYPGSQQPEVDGLPSDIRDGLELCPVHMVNEGIEIALTYAQTVSMR
jgi:ATP-dependent Lon protease